MEKIVTLHFNSTPMAELVLVKGDATAPSQRGNKIIVHICNDIGAWGKGFVMALSKRWSQPEREYRKWHASKEGFALGEVQFVGVETDIWVANMIAQHGIRKDTDGNPPIRYEALAKCLEKVFNWAREYNATVHMPKIGAGLAGGDWNRIGIIIESELSSKQIPVTVYEL